MTGDGLGRSSWWARLTPICAAVWFCGCARYLPARIDRLIVARSCWGLFSKPDVDSTQERMARGIVELLRRKGTDVRSRYPYVEEVKTGGERWKSMTVTAQGLKAADCAVAVTDDRRTDWPRMVEQTPEVVEPPNALGGIGGLARIFPLTRPPRGA